MPNSIKENISGKLANGWRYAVDAETGSVNLVHADCHPIAVLDVINPGCNRQEFAAMLVDFLNAVKPAKAKPVEK